MDRVDAVVIGAGVIGLAVARVLARSGCETLLLERENAIGTATSSRNSEVIHAGLYYDPGSLKARLCVRGREQLYAYCQTHGIAHRRCGKLIVATTPDELSGLDHLAARASANGVGHLRRLSAAEARALEPALSCAAALLSPSTGIIDSHGPMLALQGDFERASGLLAACSPVRALQCGGSGHEIEVGGAEPMRIGARIVVNAAGLNAPTLARATRGLAPDLVPPARLCKGSYFTLARGRAPFTHLIYPLPRDGGLGVHLTLDLAGQARFGPDTQWLESDDPDTIDYRVDAARGAAFHAEVRRYWPGLPADALAPAYSGVRPKLHGPGEPAADFCVQGPAEHGIAGLVNLFGIESPGLTSCLALADEVCGRLGL